MLIYWYVTAYCIVISLEQEAHLITEKSIPIDRNAKLVIFGMRHGNRHPGKFLNSLRNWGFEGAYELTQVRLFYSSFLCYG